MHFRFQVAFLMGLWRHLCARVVAMCCGCGVSSSCIFGVFHCSHWSIWHFEVWGVQGRRHCPLANCSPPTPQYPGVPPATGWHGRQWCAETEWLHYSRPE